MTRKEREERRDTMMTVKEIMKCDVVSVPYGVPVVQATKMMRQRKIGSVFVRLGAALSAL